MTLQDWSYWAAIAAAVGSWVTGLGMLVILHYTMKLSKQSKQADLLMESNRRFERIWEIRNDKNVRADPIQFWQRFWNLQFDQFTHWRQGFVEQDQFEYWMRCRHDEWVANQAFGTITYQEAWRQIKEKWPKTTFIGFMQVVHEEGVERACRWLKKNG